MSVPMPAQPKIRSLSLVRSGGTITDDELQERVSHALSSFEPLRRLPLDQVSIQVGNGVATLSGYVANDTHKELAGELAAKVPGVRAVHNKLISDSELQRGLINAFLQRRETRTVHGRMDVDLGTVTLYGPAPSDAFAQAAPEAALTVPGVKAVIDLLDFDPVSTGRERMVEALFGRPLICQGGAVGRLDQLLVDPASWQLKRAVVKSGAVMPEWLLVAGEAVSWSDARYVYLDLQPADLDRLPRFSDEALRGAGGQIAGLWRLQAGQKVVCAEGGVTGQLTGLRVDPRSGRVSHVGLRMGRLMPMSGWLPARHCRRWDRDVLTMLSREQLESAAEAGEPRSDREIVMEARDRLLALRWHAQPAGVVAPRVEHGHVTLRGRLRDARDRLAVERAIASIRGVGSLDSCIELVSTKNNIIRLDDWLLARQQALAPAQAA